MENADIFDSDVLDSKIKKVRIELPHYSFSHSSSGESSHDFVGRKKIQEKLAKLIEATTDKTGVYLVTGNRGVGKTSLVNQVINQTSLQDNSNFSKNLKYLFVLLFSVVVTQFCLQEFVDSTSFWKVYVCSIVCALASFFILGWFSGYRRKIHKQNINFLENLKEISISAAEELLFSINPYNQCNLYRPAQYYILRIILLVSYTQIISMFEIISPIQAFVFYLCFVFAFMFWRFINDKLYEYCKKPKKEELLNKKIYEIKNDLRFKNEILKYIYPSIIFLLSLIFWLLKLCLLWHLLIFIAIIFVTGAIVFSCCRTYFKEGFQLECWVTIMLRETILVPIWNYLKNYRRLYLRINFGHKLKDEKDILRLIARTLKTEYDKYLRLFKRMLLWWAMAFGFLFLFAYLFSTLIEDRKFYKQIKELHTYQASSQIFLKDSIFKENSISYLKKEANERRLQRAFSDSSKDKSKRHFLYYLKGNIFFHKAKVSLLALDDIVFEISKRAVKFPQYLWKKKKGEIDDDKTEDNMVRKFISPVDYLFWLSFFTMYLLCILIFRCDFVTHFFVTNRIIKKQLRKLNSDITYSTELENSVNIKSESIGTGIGTKTKKSRSIADAREIEKELQDILEDVQRIPFFMCRPNIVIVFDELDKVEPGESNLEDKNQKTKASLFSIDATRERQTEILKILSNMKYFLSTVKAKFIFIAGREMYDIYLADVSERNNYIGSIFNAVIYVPSFLTDPDGNPDITSLIEEFVCRRLIPNDYNRLEESYNLNEYRKYLEKYIYNDAKTKEIEQKIRNIIDKQNKETKQKIIDLKCLKDIEIKQIRNIITDQSKEMEQKIIDLQTEKIEQKIQNIIDKQSKKITALKNRKKERIQEIIGKLNEETAMLEDVKIEQKIQNIIDKQSKKIKKKIAATKYIEQIKNTIDEQNEEIKKKIVNLTNEEIKQIKNIVDEQGKKIVTLENIKIEQIQSIIDELNRKIEQKIIGELNKETEQKIQKIVAVLQQFIIYLAHVSKGAPKKMMQFFESFIEVCEIDKNEEDKCLVVQHYDKSRFFLTFNYYKQYTIGIIAYLITPIFYRLSESNIKEHSDKLLVSSLRFIDFLFKFHKHPFSWKHLDISPEMLEVNRSPALKSVTMDLLNYLAQVHINKSNFSLSDYKFDNLIADEISAMTKMDNVFSALFSFSLDEMLPLKKHYQDMLEETQKEYQNDINSHKFYLNEKSSPRFIDAISSLQVVLGDLHYYDDELEEAGVYYKNAVQGLSDLKLKNEDNEGKENETMTLEQHYVYVRNMLRLGMIYERRKQYDFAYLTYGEICKRIVRQRDITAKELSAGIVLRKDKDSGEIVFVKTSEVGKIYNKEEKKYYDNIEIPTREQCITAIDDSIASPQPLNFKKISPNTNDALFKKMTYDGLKMLYLPFIAKLQILEKSHMGGIALNHLEQLEREFTFLTNIINHKEANLLEAEFYSRLADILYYKNSDLKSKKNKNRKEDNDDPKDIKNDSCTVCYYYHKALSILLDLDGLDKNENTVAKLLSASVERINNNYNVKYCTILARILSDWGNVFFSCDARRKSKKYGNDGYKCYICDAKDCNTLRTCYQCACYCDINDCRTNNLETILKKYIDYVESEEDNRQALLDAFKKDNLSKMEIAFAMYAISLKAYTKSNLYKRSAYQIFKMLRLFKYYKVYDYIGESSKKAIRSLWQANEELNMLEINKRKKDFGKKTTKEDIPLQNILVDSEITRVRILVKDLELKLNKTAETLEKYYNLYITSPYEINYSITARIYQLRLKTTVNYEAYKMLKNYKKQKEKFWDKKEIEKEMKSIFDEGYSDNNIKVIFNVDGEMRVGILEKLIAETIFCFKEIIHLSETMGETYLFNHIFMGSIHEKLAFWVMLYELYEKKCKEEHKSSEIVKYLKKFLGKEWREQLSSYYEKEQALSHYYKCLETHNEGRAYHNMIDNMCYLKDDYNDRSDHFCIAEERHKILNGEIEEKINRLKNLYKESGLYDVDNYFEHD